MNFIQELRTMFIEKKSINEEEVFKTILNHLDSIKNDHETYKKHFELISRIFGPDHVYDNLFYAIEETYKPNIDEDGYKEWYPSFANYIGYDGITLEEINENYKVKDPEMYTI